MKWLAALLALPFLFLASGIYTVPTPSTMVITDPAGSPSIWRLDSQVIPYASGQIYSNVLIRGTYTGTAPANVSVQMCSDGACSSVVQGYTVLATPTIGGGAWSGTLQLPNNQTFMHLQAKATGTAVASSVTANTLIGGTTPLMIGQSENAHFWTDTSVDSGAGTSTGGTVTVSTYVLSNGSSGTFSAVGLGVSGTNISGGTAITVSCAGCGTATVSPVPTATGATTLTFDVAPGTSNAWTKRWAGVAFYPPSDAQHTNEQGNAAVAGANAIIDLANSLAAAGGGGASPMTYALGGTSICVWINSNLNGCSTGGNSGYQSLIGARGLSPIGNDVDVIWWSQGVTDAIGPMSQANYLANLGTLETFLHSQFRATALFGIQVMDGNKNGGTDANYDAIRQAELSYIDTNASGLVFYIPWQMDLAHVDNVHLHVTRGYNRMVKRYVQAWRRATGQSASGYGPKIASMAGPNSGSVVTVTVTHEAGTALTSTGLSSSGTSLTGFACKLNGSADAITATAFSQPNLVTLTLTNAWVGADTVVCSYGAGANPSVTKNVYDNVNFGDTDGLPLQPSRGPDVTVSHP